MVANATRATATAAPESIDGQVAFDELGELALVALGAEDRPPGEDDQERVDEDAEQQPGRGSGKPSTCDRADARHQREEQRQPAQEDRGGQADPHGQPSLGADQRAQVELAELGLLADLARDGPGRARAGVRPCVGW